MRSFGETPGKREALLNKLVKISETPVKREETPEKGEEPSVVTGYIPFCAIAGGHPAKPFKYRNIEHYNKLEKEQL